jgi:hypothetical protein
MIVFIIPDKGNIALAIPITNPDVDGSSVSFKNIEPILKFNEARPKMKLEIII